MIYTLEKHFHIVLYVNAKQHHVQFQFTVLKQNMIITNTVDQVNDDVKMVIIYLCWKHPRASDATKKRAPHYGYAVMSYQNSNLHGYCVLNERICVPKMLWASY